MPDKKRLIHTIREAFPLRSRNGGVIIDDIAKFHKIISESGYKPIYPNPHLENSSQNAPSNESKEAI